MQKFFALFDQLEERHLRALQAEFGSSAGDILRREIKAWARSRINTIDAWADAHAAVVAILGEAPLDSIPYPAAAGSALLDAACPFELEERHLRALQAEFGSSAGDVLRREIKAWLTTRIDLATTNARELVRALNEQTRLASVTRPAAPLPDYDPQEAKATARRERRALPKSPRKRSAPAGKGRTHNGTVLSTNPHGVVVSLDNGEQGWLHVSRLRQLNGGAWVESASDVLAVGQELRVRGVGTTSRGQVELSIVDVRAIKRVDTKSTAPATESLGQDKPLPAQSRRAGNRWFKFGRYGEERT